MANTSGKSLGIYTFKYKVSKLTRAENIRPKKLSDQFRKNSIFSYTARNLRFKEVAVQQLMYQLSKKSPGGIIQPIKRCVPHNF